MIELQVDKLTVRREGPRTHVVCGCGAEFWGFTEDYLAADVMQHFMEAHRVSADDK